MEPVNRSDHSSTTSPEYQEGRYIMDIGLLHCSRSVPHQIALTDRLKRSLCREPDAVRLALIRSGIVPRLIDFMKDDANYILQYNAAWILTSVIEGHSRSTEVTAAIPCFIQLMHSQYEVVKHQAIWSLGGFADISERWRGLLISKGILTHVLEILRNNTRVYRKAATYCLSTLCRGILPDRYRVVPVLSPLLRHSDTEIVVDACWALANFLAHVDGELPESRIQEVIDCGLCEHVVELLRHPSENVVKPTLIVVTEIILGHETQVQTILDCPVLANLLHVLENTAAQQLRTMACESIVCITSTNGHVQTLIDANIIPSLISVIDCSDADTSMVRNAIMAIYNIALEAHPLQIRTMVEAGCIDSLRGRLESDGNDGAIESLASRTLIILVERPEE